jgi:hypothetical protein
MHNSYIFARLISTVKYRDCYNESMHMYIRSGEGGEGQGGSVSGGTGGGGTYSMNDIYSYMYIYMYEHTIQIFVILNFNIFTAKKYKLNCIIFLLIHKILTNSILKVIHHVHPCQKILRHLFLQVHIILNIVY